jgi:hypothetical protein
MSRLYIRGTFAERLWPRVDKNGPIVREELGPCWLFIGGTIDTYGRGSIAVRQEDGSYRMTLVHRAVWVEENGPIPVGVQILHRCDTSNCCRLSHLYAGGYAENAEDCSSRGRRSSGKVVTRAMVLIIREAHADGLSINRLAREVGLSPASISCIVKRQTWKHV